jgi:hypothetical protein
MINETHKRILKMMGVNLSEQVKPINTDNTESTITSDIENYLDQDDNFDLKSNVMSIFGVDSTEELGRRLRGEDELPNMTLVLKSQAYAKKLNKKEFIKLVDELKNNLKERLK